MPKLGVIIASVREGRNGLAVATWFVERARQHGTFDVSVIDLKQIDLPLLQVRKHPRFAEYDDARTKAWSAIIAPLDAFVIVTPEYNFSSPPALINALDHLYKEWNYKAIAFVSYGGVSGGTRSVEMTKQILTAMKMVPIVESVTIPYIAKAIDPETGQFLATDSNEKAATVMLDELLRWTAALATLRA